MKKIILLIPLIILVAGCSNQTPREHNLNMIQGEWKSIEDERSVIEFRDGLKLDVYDGEQLSEGDFDLYNDARGSMRSDNGAYLIADDFVYNIIELTNESLVLMYLPRGNILKYERY